MDTILKRVQEKIQQSLKGVRGDAKFFGNFRRGEAAELKSDLNSVDLGRQKNAVKRLIASMTMGKDVSTLFADVVKLGQTNNLELKKLVYLYVLNTAKLQPEKAVMAVNTFLQDATNPSPIVRALAVRTMLCIRVSSVVEYTMEPLRRAVEDPDPYVRKTAAIGIGKLFHHNMNTFYDNGFYAELQKLLSDSNPVVTSNAAAIVGEVKDYGREPLNSKPEWMNRLLLNLPDTTEWGQVYLLDLLSRLKPQDAESAETMATRMLPRLNHTNPAVVMGAIKVIAKVAGYCTPEAIARYTVRINAALLTLAQEDFETQYIVFKNIHALLVIFPNILRGHLDAFYVRFNDPPYVKLEKLRLLLKLVTPSTAASIVDELAEYGTEVDLVFLEEVVYAIATLAIKVEKVSVQCSELLLSVLQRRPQLLACAVIAAKNIVRKYSDLLLVEPLTVQYGADMVVEEEAKVSLVWMLGEYCDFIEGGRAILQQYIDSLMSHEPSVQLSILCAVVKMFLHDTAGMEPTLSAVLKTITTQSEDPDVRDRAFAYWRLLSKGVSVNNMSSILHDRGAFIDADHTFSDAMTMADLKKSINTTAVVFAQPFQSFLPPYGVTDVDCFDEEDEDLEDSRSIPVCSAQETLNSPAPLHGQQQEGGKSGVQFPVNLLVPEHVSPLDNLFDSSNLHASLELSQSEDRGANLNKAVGNTRRNADSKYNSSLKSDQSSVLDDLFS